jgi:two-component system chemotaxis response regulator CheY
MGKARILVIGDEPAMREVLQRLLDTAGYVTAFAANGADGLVEYRRMPAVLVIVDLFMPEMDGLETIVELGKESPAPAIIAMSGHPGRDVMLRCSERLGALETIGKPFEPAALVQAVERVLQREW